MKHALRGMRSGSLRSICSCARWAFPSMFILRILFSPEHGLYSALQDGKFGDEDGSLHPGTGARLYSLGAKGHPALAELVGGVDLAVYDIQDVGARFYTYLCNLTQLMRACRAAGKPLLVLDRPNPIGKRE